MELRNGLLFEIFTLTFIGIIAKAPLTAFRHYLATHGQYLFLKNKFNRQLKVGTLGLLLTVVIQVALFVMVAFGNQIQVIADVNDPVLQQVLSRTKLVIQSQIIVFSLHGLKVLSELGTSFALSFNDFEFCALTGVFKLVVFFVTLDVCKRNSTITGRYSNAFIYSEAMSAVLGVTASLLYIVKYRTQLKKLEVQVAKRSFEERCIELTL